MNSIMKKITFNLYKNRLFLYYISDTAFEKNVKLGDAKPVSFKKTQEGLINLDWEVLKEIAKEKVEIFEDGISELDIDINISYIPKSHPIFIKVEDSKTETEQIYKVNFERKDDTEKSLVISPKQKISFPHEVESSDYLIEYDKVYGSVCLECEDFDISKLEVKEYFHKLWHDDAILLSYDGVDLLKNVEIESASDTRFFLGKIDKFQGLEDPL